MGESVLDLFGQLRDTSVYRELVEVGAAVATFGALGGLGGFLTAVAWRSASPTRELAYGEWTAYGAGLSGAFALCLELFDRAGLG